MKLIAHPRHPVTGRRFTVRGRTPREFEALMHHVDELRRGLRFGTKTPEEVSRTLRRLRFGPTTFEKAALSYAARADLSKNTRNRVRYVLAGPLAELAPLEIDALDGDTIAPIFERLTGSRETLTTVWRTLRAIVRHASERGWVGASPWGLYRPRARGARPALRECARTRVEREQLIDGAFQVGGFTLAAKVAACAYLGLRHGELAGLRMYDLYPNRQIVGVRRQWDGLALKTHEIKELDAPSRLFTLLAAHIELHELVGAGAPLFPAPSGGHYKGGECLSIVELRRAVERAGLPSPRAWTVHSLRDTFATVEYHDSGGDLTRVMQRTRHASLSSLFRYLRTIDRADRPMLSARAPANLLPAAAGT